MALELTLLFKSGPALSTYSSCNRWPGPVLDLVVPDMVTVCRCMCNIPGVEEQTMFRVQVTTNPISLVKDVKESIHILKM